MKIIIYYLLLLVFIALLTGLLIQGQQATMTMGKMLSISILLAVYAVVISLVGEGQTEDERALHHRYRSNRAALAAGTILLSAGILYQLFTHRLDYWLLAGLITINLVKIVSLIYSNYKH